MISSLVLLISKDNSKASDSYWLGVAQEGFNQGSSVSGFAEDFTG